MSIICIEANDLAVKTATQAVRSDNQLSRISIVKGFSTDPDVIRRVTELIKEKCGDRSPVIIGPMAELLGSIATLEGSEYIYRCYNDAFPSSLWITGPSRYASVRLCVCVCVCVYSNAILVQFYYPCYITSGDLTGSSAVHCVHRKKTLVGRTFVSVNKLKFDEVRSFPTPGVLEFVDTKLRKVVISTIPYGLWRLTPVAIYSRKLVHMYDASWRVSRDTRCNSIGCYIWFAFDDGVDSSDSKTDFPYGCSSFHVEDNKAPALTFDGSSNFNDRLTCTNSWRNLVFWLQTMNLVAGELLRVVTRVDTEQFDVSYEFQIYRGREGKSLFATISVRSSDILGCDWIDADLPVSIVPLSAA